MTFNVSSAEKLNFLLHSTCKEVRSKRRGGSSVPCFLLIFVMQNNLSLIRSRSASPIAWSVMGGIPRLSVSLAFLLASFFPLSSSANSSSSFLMMAEKVVLR